jgi:hypothetical protein
MQSAGAFAPVQNPTDPVAAAMVQRIANQLTSGVYVDGPGVFTHHRLRLNDTGRLELTAELCNAGRQADAAFAARCMRGDMTRTASSISIDLADIDFPVTRAKTVSRLVTDNVGPTLVPATSLVYLCKSGGACVTARSGSRYSGFELYCDDGAACQRLRTDLERLAGVPGLLPPPFTATAPAGPLISEHRPVPARPADPSPIKKILERVKHINVIAAAARHSAPTFDKDTQESGQAAMDIAQSLTFDAATTMLRIHKVTTYQTVFGTRRVTATAITSDFGVPLRGAEVIFTTTQTLQTTNGQPQTYRAVGLQCPDNRKCVSFNASGSRASTAKAEPYIDMATIDCDPSACDAVAADVVEITRIVLRSKL